MDSHIELKQIESGIIVTKVVTEYFILNYNGEWVKREPYDLINASEAFKVKDVRLRGFQK